MSTELTIEPSCSTIDGASDVSLSSSLSDKMTRSARGSNSVTSSQAAKEVPDDILNWNDRPFQKEFKHRIIRKIYDKDKAHAKVAIPKLPKGSRPLLLEWDCCIDKSNESAWPPKGCALGDCEVFLVIQAELPARKRAIYYGDDFDQNGDILKGGPNWGKAAIYAKVAPFTT